MGRSYRGLFAGAPGSIDWHVALGFAAAGMLLADPAVALACGWFVELACDPALGGVERHEGED